MRAPMKIFCPVVSRTAVLFFIAALLLGHAGLRAGEFDIIINELNYNVFDNGGEDSLEFIELYNRGYRFFRVSLFFRTWEATAHICEIGTPMTLELQH